jgi:hypothetical protein
MERLSALFVAEWLKVHLPQSFLLKFQEQVNIQSFLLKFQEQVNIQTFFQIYSSPSNFPVYRASS